MSKKLSYTQGPPSTGLSSAIFGKISEFIESKQPGDFDNSCSAAEIKKTIFLKITESFLSATSYIESN